MNEQGVDRISELPDDVLVKILSCLTLKEAVFTSLLSTRWIDLWKFYSGCLDFDGSAIVYDLSRQFEKAVDGCSITSMNQFDYIGQTERHQFINWVNQVLGLHKGGTFKRLQVNFDLTDLSDQVIDNWIKIAASKSVQWLEIDLSSYNYTGNSLPLYSFPNCRFRSLRSLSLKYVGMCGEILESILFDCPDLEELKITYTGSLHRTGSLDRPFKLHSLSLKHLTLWACAYIVDVIISAPNLLSFAYPNNQSTEINIVLEDVPSLKCVTILCDWSHITSHLSQLHQLALSMMCGPLLDPELTNLTTLTITDCSISDHSIREHLVRYLKAAPLLQNLTLELCEAVELTEAGWNKEEYHHHNSLKTVKLINFGRTKDAEIIRYFLSCAPLLDEIIIDPCQLSYLETPGETSYRQSTEYIQDRDHAINVTSSVPFNNIYVV